MKKNKEIENINNYGYRGEKRLRKQRISIIVNKEEKKRFEETEDIDNYGWKGKGEFKKANSKVTKIIIKELIN